MARRFPARTHASSTKGFTGHTLGAAGIVEAAVCLLALDTGLMPGTYTVHEVQPGGWIDGKDTLGTGATGGAGTAGNDVFSDVVLQDGNHAIDYNFGEHKPDVSAIPTLSQSLALLALLMAGFAVRRRVHG